MKTTRLAIVFALLLVPTLAFASGQGEEGAAPSNEITVTTSMGGDLLGAFETVAADFSQATDYEVTVEAVSDIATLLVTRAEANDLPDATQMARPGQMADFVEQGVVVELDPAIAGDFPQAFIDLGSVDGKYYGVFIDASLKSLIWYNPKVWEANGYEIPQTWDELMDLSDQMVADGTPPWVLGLESGAGSGWPGTDWMEQIILRMHGPQFYDQWVNHEVEWTDERVVEAWELFGTLFNDSEYAYGGNQTILTLPWNEAPNYLFTDPPQANMYLQGTFVQSFIKDNNPDVTAGEDYSVFVFPPINEEHGNPLMGAGDLVFGFTDSPAVREYLEHLTTVEAQTVFAETGQGLAVNVNVPQDAYPDPINAEAASILSAAETFRFDGSDLMPTAVGSGTFWTGMMDYFSGTNLEQVLQTIERSADRAYE